MTFAGIFGLLVFIYMRPHEFVDGLDTFPFLYLFLGIIIVGIGIDVATRKSRLLRGPQLRIALIFWAWCILGAIIRTPATVVTLGINISVALTLFVVVTYGVQSVTRFMRTTLLIFALGLFVASVDVHQGLQDFNCIAIIPLSSNGKGVNSGISCPMIGPDGEPLDGLAKCYEDGEVGRSYLCEKPGLFGTFSIAGRVRYLGVLQDPNEVALATSMAVPFAFSFVEQRRSLIRILLLLITLAAVGITVYFTQSRGGQLVFSTVLGAYFIKRYGVKRGVIIAAILAVPLLVFGGRSGEEADQSALERMEAAAAGMHMMINYPATGVGLSQFLEHHYLTAHNAYILAAGELGFPGMCIFVTLLVVSIKIPIAVLQHDLTGDPEVDKVKSLAMAMLATFIGAAIGIFFLSWTYHYVLWIHFGLSGALFSVIKAKDPNFEVKVGRRDVALSIGICVVMLIALFIQTKRKGVW